MGSYTFKWEHPAQEVFVTGNFDNWTKSVHLQHNGHQFEKTFEFPSYVSTYERIDYKFVVDGHWTADYNKYHENDGSGNINNVLFQHDLTHKPAAQESSHQTSQQQEEHHMPGEFPETPAPNSENFFGVSPLPAFPSGSNPTNIAPGRDLPHHSEFTSNTVTSNVTHDKESYERSDAYPSSAAPMSETGIFGVPSLSVNRNIIPESSLPMGSGADTRSLDFEPGPTIQSAGAGTSTSELAGQVPREPRGVPEVVHESQQRAHQSPEASANTEAVMEKKDFERELLSKVPTEQGESESAREFTSGAHVPQAVKHSAQLAHASPEAAAYPEAVSHKDALESELLQRVHKEETTSGPGAVPSVVKESQYEAGQSPEASANPEAVSEKEQVEQELKSKISPTNTQADTGSKIGDYAVAGASAVGLTGIAAAIGKNMQTSGQGVTSATSMQDAASRATPALQSTGASISNTFQNTLNQATHAFNNATGSGATTESSSYAHESTSRGAPAQSTGASISNTFQNTVNQATHAFDNATGSGATTESSSTSIGQDAYSRAVPALQSTGASISNTFQSTLDKATNAFGNITGTNAAAENVPIPVQHSIAQQVTRGPEAASNPQAVTEKSVMERELLSSMGASGQSHGAAAAVPEVVRESMSSTSRGPEAAAYPEAVSEKSAVERELLSSVHPAGASHGSSHVPEAVQDSISHSSRGPEAAANPEAVDEKSAVEKELLSAVRPTNESGEPAPSHSAALSATAPGDKMPVVPSMQSTGLHAPENFARNAPSSSRSEALASPQLYDSDTAPAIAAMQRDLNLSERPAGSSSNTYSSAPQTTSSSQYQHSAPPAQGYNAHQQSVIDRVFGAPLNGSQATSSARSVEPVAAAPVAVAAPAPIQEVKREVEQPKAAPSKPLSNYANIQNQTHGGNTLAFQHDPISASSGSAMSHASSAIASDPRKIAAAFAQDPVSAAPVRSSSLAGAPSSRSTSAAAPITSAAPMQSSRQVSNPAALAASAASRSVGGGLNAPASHPAQTPATEAASKPISMPKTLRAPHEDSRDVSPMGHGASQPTVTTGVSTQTTPARTTSTPPTSQPSSSTSTPTRPSPGTGSDKNSKRKSFFGKLKEKMSGHKDDAEFDGIEDEDELEVEEEGDSGFEDGVTAGNGELEPLLHTDGALDLEEKKQEPMEDISARKHDIKVNLEQNQETATADTIQSVKETANVVVDETKRKLNTATHRNGASFMAACLVAAAAIVLVWGRK